MRQGFNNNHFNDENNNPAGGCSYGVGFSISWQNGPLGRDEKRIKSNGAFVEDIIDVVIDRLNYYQESKFNCNPNAIAIDCLKSALAALDNRTADREKRKVEGTHSV